MTPPSPALGKTQATGLYTPTNWHLPGSFIRHLNARIITYTEGSATGGPLSDGVGMVVIEGDPITLFTKHQRGAYAKASDEEKAAIRMALEWFLPSHTAAAICTDTQSLLKVIQSGTADTADQRRILSKQAGKTTLLWIPGHDGIAGNRRPVLSKRQLLLTARPDQSPSLQPVLSSAEP